MAAITQESLNEAQRLFDTCFETRKGWDQLLNREWETQLPPELAKIQQGLDYQTPDLEKALHDHVDVLKMNPTVYDVVSLDQSPSKRKLARDILMWTARGWEYENEGRWWDRAVAEGQVRHGYKVMRLMHRPQQDPDVAASTAEEVLEERDKAARKRRHPFYWQDVNTYSVTWLGDESSEYGPDVCFMEYEIPYLDAKGDFSRKTTSGDDEFPTLNALSKVAWLGQDDTGDEQWHDKKVKVVVVDARDPKNRKCPLPGCNHYQRIIQVYVMAEGNELDKDNLVSEIDSPYPGCSFFVVAGRMTSSRDPNRRFRPLMYGLYPESEITNNITTLLLTMIRADYDNQNNLYLDVSEVKDPGLLPEDHEQHYVDWSPEDGKLQWLPGEVKRVPLNISPHLATLRQEHLQKLTSYMPNKFQMGEAYTEASNATSTAFTLQMQQSHLPHDNCLSNSDTIQKRAWDYKFHAIKFWAQGMAEPDRYYAVTSGQTDIAKVNGNTPKAGTVVYIDAEKLNLDFDLVLRTKSDTLAEEGIRWQQAKDMYDNGVYSPDQLARAAGIDDVEGQWEKLEEAWQTQIMEPDVQNLIRQVNLRGFYGKTGLDIGQLQPPPVQGPQSQPQQQPQQQTRQRQPGPPQGVTVAPNMPVTAGNAPTAGVGQGPSPVAAGPR